MLHWKKTAFLKQKEQIKKKSLKSLKVYRSWFFTCKSRCICSLPRRSTDLRQSRSLTWEMGTWRNSVFKHFNQSVCKCRLIHLPQAKGAALKFTKSRDCTSQGFKSPCRLRKRGLSQPTHPELLQIASLPLEHLFVLAFGWIFHARVFINLPAKHL